MAALAASVWARRGLEVLRAPAGRDLVQLPGTASEDLRACGSRARSDARAKASESPASAGEVAENALRIDSRREHAQAQALGLGPRGPAADARAGTAPHRPCGSAWGSRSASSSSRSRSMLCELPAAADPRYPGAGGDLRAGSPTRGRHMPSASPTRDVVRGLRGQFDHPPDVVARPRAESDLERLLEWCEAAAGRGDPLRRRDLRLRRRDPGCRPRLQRRRLDRSRGALDRLLELDEVSPAASIEAGPPGPAWRPSSPSTISPCATSRSPSSTPRSAAGSPPERRVTSRALDAHRGLRRVRPRAHARRRMGVPAAARLGRRPQPRPDARRLGGHARDHHPRPGSAFSRRPRHRSLGGSPLRAFRQAPSVCGDLPGRPFPRQLPPARRRRGRPDDGRRRQPCAARARIRVDRPSRRGVDGSGACDLRRARRQRRAPRARGPARGRRRLVAGRLPRRALPARPAGSDGRPLGDLRDGHHLGALPRPPRACQRRR